MEYQIADLNDDALLLMIKSGERSAFSEIYRRYWPILYRHAYRMLRAESESEDVVQDTFVNLWNAAADLPEGTALGAYLYTMVRNRVLNMIAKSAVHASYRTHLEKFMVNGYELSDHLVREKILAKLIQEEIEKLPSRMREVFEHKRVDHLSYKEIAEIMDISELTVKTQMNKAITILRKKLGDHIAVFFTLL